MTKTTPSTSTDNEFPRAWVASQLRFERLLRSFEPAAERRFPEASHA
jgi:hypothetical protein